MHEVFEFFFRRIGVLVEQKFSRENHARSAKAALKPAVLDKGLLQRMQRAITLCQPFNR